MGTEILEETGPRPTWRVAAGSPPAGSQVSVDVGNAGTVMRFLPGVAALTSAAVHFDGDARARQRPVGPILAALRQLGTQIDDGGRAAVPFTVHGRGAVRGGTVTLDASGSSQLISGLLLTAPRFDEGIEIRHEGPPVPSAPHIAMTVRMLRAAGADVTESSSGAAGSGAGRRPDAWRVRPGRIDLGAITVEPDLSNAGPFLAAALVTAGTITVPDWPQDSLQAAGEILDVLTRMGARCEVSADGLTVTGTGRIHGIDADLRDVNELAPVLTAVAAMADSPSVFTGLAHTRSHETDRLAALAKEINALGGDITERPDGLQIRPRPLRASEPFGSYDDHRMVMAAAVLGLAVPGLQVVNADTVAKTFPGFTDVWAAMLEREP
jgi:3-phosphoshikimate 1-carboxyvinyltransferase